MRITNLKPSTKGNIILYTDDKYVCHLHPEIVVKYGLFVNKNIDIDFINELIEESNLHYANQKALNLISYKERSKKELIEKLSKSFDDISATKIADKMENLGLVNDERLAKIYIEDYIFRKRYSINKTKYEIEKKGIDKNIIEDVLDSIDIDESENVEYLLSTKYKNKLNNEKDLKKVINSLLRMGYGWSIINSVMRKLTP